MFHENSKTSRFDTPPTTQEVLAEMASLWESLPFHGYPAIELPAKCAPISLTLSEAMERRATARDIHPVTITLLQLGTLLRFAYGLTRDNAGTVFPRPFRTVPSGGGLYPLEIFFHSARVTSLPAGMYHYNATEHRLKCVREGDESRKIAEGLVQANLAVDTSLIFFITALFERSVFKYGDRGYRFTLLEAGHVAQNLNLTAVGLGLGCVNIGGYFDRQMDQLLEINGVDHSTVYLVGIGGSAGDAASERAPVERKDIASLD